MAANPAAAKFIKNLIGTFSKFPVTPETKEIYLQKLSRYELRQSQWDKTLDLLINRELENLPSLHEIYDAIRNAGLQDAEQTNFGWVSFDWRGRPYSIRVINHEGQWLIAPLIYHDQHGKECQAQKHVGDPWMDHMPSDAENVIISPDNQANPEPHEIPTREERAQFMWQINQNCQKMKM